MKHYIAIDLGATSGRVILASVAEDKTVSLETVHRFRTPMIEEEGKYFWDIQDIFQNIIRGLKTVAGKGLGIESIGIDTWGVDFVGVKADGSLCGRPRAYRDPYSFTAQDAFLSEMPREELYDRTGIQIMNFNSVFQMYAQSKAGDLEQADRILFLPDAFSYLLTGGMVCEYTILSTSAMMDPRTKKLDDRILEVCGLSADRFPEIVFPGHVVGRLTGEVQSLTGLGAVPVVAVAGHRLGSGSGSRR